MGIRGPEPVIRNYKTNREDSLKYKPTYVFAKDFRGQKEGIPVLFEGADLEGRITGRHLDVRYLDRAVYRLYKEERKKAWTVFYFLQHEHYGDDSMKDLREKARELFVSMQAVDEEIRHTGPMGQETLRAMQSQLNNAFHELVVQMHIHSKLLTLRNPWLLTFLKYSDADCKTEFTQAMVEEFCIGIRAKGRVECSKVIFEEIEAIPRFTEYRDTLPSQLTSKYSQHTYSAKGKEMYREWADSLGNSFRSGKQKPKTS